MSEAGESRRVSVVLGRKPVLLLTACVVVLAGGGVLFSQQLTMSATYPIPAGVYNQIVTTGNSGSTPANTTLNRNAGNTILVPPTNPSGRVGIGTAAPLQALDVQGAVRAGSSGALLYSFAPGNFGGKEAVLSVADGAGGASDEILIGPNLGASVGHIILSGNVHAFLGVQVGDDPAGCTAAKEGTLRSHAGAMEVCTSGAWTGLSGGTVSWYENSAPCAWGVGCEVVVPCPAGKSVVSGGCNSIGSCGANIFFYRQGPYANGWRCAMVQETGCPETVQTIAGCR